jgi:hypothetical protein
MERSQKHGQIAATFNLRIVRRAPNMASIDHSENAQDLRREINALHGLLSFSQERRYPSGITSSLRQMLVKLEQRLVSSEQTGSSHA